MIQNVFILVLFIIIAINIQAKKYRVQKNDTLMTVSFKHYGTHQCWQNISKRNPSLKNTNKIEVGSWLNIPGPKSCKHKNKYQKISAPNFVYFDQYGKKNESYLKIREKRPKNFHKRKVYSNPALKAKRLKKQRILAARRRKKELARRKYIAAVKLKQAKREAKLARIKRKKEEAKKLKLELARKKLIAETEEKARQKVINENIKRQRNNEMNHIKELARIQEIKKKEAKELLLTTKKLAAIEKKKRLAERRHAERILKKQKEILKLQNKIKYRSIKKENTYSIQFGAYPSRELAEHACSKLLSMGVNSRIFKGSDKEGRIWFRVRSRDFSLKSQAKDFARKFQIPESIPDFFIVRN